MPGQKNSVYILKSETLPSCYYVGLTSDVSVRLKTHNAGGSVHTELGRPWRVVVTVEFDDEAKALRFRADT